MMDIWELTIFQSEPGVVQVWMVNILHHTVAHTVIDEPLDIWSNRE